MDKSRKQFEAWVMSQPAANRLDVMKSGEKYSSYEIQRQWGAWQASRAVVEIEIQEAEKWRSPEAVRAQRAMLVLVKQAIRAAGIKVKGSDD
ncbi:hypothetical protein EHJ06_21385 [Cronobacter malonaticus]|uniref:hypothetical protein n=1 Tax=Cronobacter malonaticus TaxID=413503 RepID=UPI0013759657|nr:hypothetical protein [Cronobacter malonaticus]NCH03878.1 hypothetical protein [Cronobacter malonaticus]